VDALRDVLERPDATGVAIICGAISGGLVVCDFDDDRAYARWVTSNYALAETLPSVKTSRGYHLYARCDDKKTRTLADGELRGEGAYVVAPPSLHPTGWRYEWTARPFGEIPSVDVRELLSNGGCVSERLQITGRRRTRPNPKPRQNRRQEDWATMPKVEETAKL